MQIAFINNEDLWISIDSVDIDAQKEDCGTGKPANPGSYNQRGLCTSTLAF